MFRFLSRQRREVVRPFRPRGWTWWTVRDQQQAERYEEQQRQQGLPHPLAPLGCWAFRSTSTKAPAGFPLLTRRSFVVFICTDSTEREADLQFLLRGFSSFQVPTRLRASRRTRLLAVGEAVSERLHP